MTTDKTDRTDCERACYKWYSVWAFKHDEPGLSDWQRAEAAWQAAWDARGKRDADIAMEFCEWPPKRKFVFKHNEMTGSWFGDADTADSAARQIAKAIEDGE